MELALNNLDDDYAELEHIVIDFLNGNKPRYAEINAPTARKGKKTHNVVRMSAFLQRISQMTGKRVAIYGARLFSAELKQLQKDVVEGLAEYHFQPTDNKRKVDEMTYYMTAPNNRPFFLFNTGSFIELLGIYKSSGIAMPLKGLASCKDFDLAIIWMEEASEFSKTEMNAFIGAVRGYKHVIVIKTANPDSPYLPFVEYCKERVPFDEKALMQDKPVILKNSIIEDGLTKLFIYANIWVNQYLTDEEIAWAYQMKRDDPELAKAWVYGCPAGMSTSIFARYLNDLYVDPHFQPVSFRGGLDLGYADTPQGHDTVCQIVAYNAQGQKQTWGEFVHNNHEMQHLSPDQIARKLINWIKEFADENPLVYRKGLTIYVDYGSHGAVWMDWIKQIQAGMFDNSTGQVGYKWLRFESVVKDVWAVRDRIDSAVILLNSHELQINKQRTPYLVKKMALMEWKPMTAQQQLGKANYKLEPLDLHDDPFDALCYAIMPDLDLSVRKQVNGLYDKRIIR